MHLMRRFLDGRRLSTSTGGRLLLCGLLLAFTACELDVANPNAPTREEALEDPNGLVSLAVGMQGQYASQVDEFVLAPALVTDEWGTTTSSLLSYRSLFLTGTENEISPGYGVVEAPWGATYQVVRSADDLIANVPASDLPPGLQSGILATARLFKAMALGSLALHFEEMPVDVSGNTPSFVSRDSVFSTVLGLLEQARTDVGNADVSLTQQRILSSGFSLPNTIDAMLARYHLFAGNYQDAITAADRVNPNVLSVFNYTGTSQNPVWNLSSGQRLGYVSVLNSWAQAADPGDARVDYWADTAAAPVQGNPPDSLLIPLERYATSGATFPVYLPDEMDLIRAEAYTRTDQFGLARQEINDVRTETEAEAVAGEPYADLSALPQEDLDSEQELLEQIAYERRYELYSQGLRWEDVRRLGSDVTTTPTTDFLPTPAQECDNNPNAAGC